MFKKRDLVKTKNANASGLHKTVLALVRRLYPGFTVLEEQSIEVSVGGKTKTLFVDIVIKELRVCIECQGRQHSQFVPHFHRQGGSRAKGVHNDVAKHVAIYECGHRLVTVDEHERDTITASQLNRRIQTALKGKI